VNSVLILTGIYPPDIGGPATYVPRFADFLESKGWRVNILTLADRGKASRESEITFVTRDLFKPIRTAMILFHGIRLARKSDVIFLNGLYEEGSLIAALTKKPSVAKIVGDPIWERYRNTTKQSPDNPEALLNHKPPFKYRIQRKFFTWAVNQFTTVTCPGGSLAHHLQLTGIRKEILVIENGTSISSLQNLEKKYDVISVSRLVPWKNLQILAESARREGFSLLIVGDGPEMSFLKSSFSDAAIFVGQKSQQEISDLMDESKVFALISSYEGLSFSLIQALSRGLPVVVSDIAANRDVLAQSEAGLIVPLLDVERTGIAIKELINSEGLRLRMSQAARNLAESNFNEVRQLQRMMDLLTTNE
jgi:glycosyltransferase involved in cell wall biosynthesis